MKYKVYKWLAAIIIIFLAAFYVVFDVIPRQTGAWDAGRCTACHTNMKEIGAALKAYSADNNGEYPESMKMLVPDYIKSIPTCPAARREVYSRPYRTSKDYKRYTFFCEGENHKGIQVPRNFPQYNSQEGLWARP